MTRPPSFFECAVVGCTVKVDGTGGDALYRISPKGGPFAGMCPEHFYSSATFELKQEAVAIMEYKP